MAIKCQSVGFASISGRLGRCGGRTTSGLIKLGILGCLLGSVTSCQNPAAPDEVVIRQRTSAVLPGLDGTIKVRVGDIKRGKTADVEIIGADSVTLASKKGAQVGDRIAYTHNGKKYQVEVVRYRDDIGPGDSATLRNIPLPGDGPAAPEK